MNTIESGAYTNFAGADIVVMLNDIVFGDLQQVTYAVHREVAPLYALGSANPRGFAKNKRGISGTMVFLVFDKDALFDAAKNSKLASGRAAWGRTAKANLYTYDQSSGMGVPMGYSNYANLYNPANWNATMNNFVTGGRPQETVTKVTLDQLFAPLTRETIRYADQIPPFTITITMANEYGAAASMSIYGAQIINEGSGISIDDLVTEKAVTFVATDIKPLSEVTGRGAVYDESNRSLRA